GAAAGSRSESAAAVQLYVHSNRRAHSDLSAGNRAAGEGGSLRRPAGLHARRGAVRQGAGDDARIFGEVCEIERDAACERLRAAVAAAAVAVEGGSAGESGDEGVRGREEFEGEFRAAGGAGPAVAVFLHGAARELADRRGSDGQRGRRRGLGAAAGRKERGDTFAVSVPERDAGAERAGAQDSEAGVLGRRGLAADAGEGELFCGEVYAEVAAGQHDSSRGGILGWRLNLAMRPLGLAAARPQSETGSLVSGGAEARKRKEKDPPEEPRVGHPPQRFAQNAVSQRFQAGKPINRAGGRGFREA